MTFATGLVFLINNLIGAYVYVLIAYVILSWLIGFGVVNSRNPVVAFVNQITDALVEPVVSKLRKLMPFLVVGPIDLSVIALFFILQVVQLGLITLVM